ncbi:DUF4082 domain-containing protein [Cereibacter johrii]|uniref:DUF4082 domain-containing protein n=1 Tax=Cereibacter johrii TaxID=445629 RepID=UPI002B25685B|nr:DUF4082 domain-containing protein [Cereibacter johrii]MEA5163216.1 DUF4082 domain-containing protein [Cereibacter johrii]
MTDNAIVVENARTDGVMPKSYWDVEHSTFIEGFATDISVNAGQRIDFKINVNDEAGSDYKVEVFRLGYYGGGGARKVAEWVNTDAKVQDQATYNPTLGLVDAGNWSVTDSWLTPTDAVSGVYIARVQRLDASGNPIAGEVNQIPFILREDDRASDIVLQTSDTTWQAYNGWGGNNGQIGANLYGDVSGTIDHPDIPGASSYEPDRAYAVSYNRPLITRGIDGQQGGVAAGAQDYLFGADYAAIYWLEKNGYDVSYMSGVDTDRLGADYLKKYQAFISVGHDEYWSGGQRANVEEARDDGVNLLFWGGNDVYWKTRYEASAIDGVDYRTLVCYKETTAVADPTAGPEDYYNLDPTDIWTGTWRDTRFHGNPLAGGGLPDDFLSGQCPTCNCAENSLTGQLFGPDGTGEFGGALDVTGEYAQLRVWRDTTIANGGALDIAPGLLGYEWNTSPDDYNRPAGLVHLSETTIPWGAILTDQGNTTAPGIATHNLSLYRAESGALVFGAGTVFWTWALSNLHDGEPYDAQIENRDLQQFVVNMFADMGIQPGVADAVLASQGLLRALASADAAPATALINDLPDTLPALETVTITGTATDDDGNPLTQDGRVALVEVSLDGGTTWTAAQGTTNWSFSWTPTRQGVFDIRVRAFDDSLNLPVAVTLDRETVEITAPVVPPEVSLFDPFVTFNGQSHNDNMALELGTRFTALQTGSVTELRYYRAASDATDTDTRTGHLWRADGTLLATVTFVSTPGQTGWQTAELSSPITLAAGQSYVVSYTTQDNYVGTSGFFSTAYVDPYGILSAGAGTGGVFALGSNIFPSTSYQGTSYWVDITFAPQPAGTGLPVFAGPSTFSVAENDLYVGTVAATDPQGQPISYAIAGGADAGLFSIDAKTGALHFRFPANHELPTDADGNNIFQFRVTATDLTGEVATRDFSVTLTDVVDESLHPSLLFGPTDAPAATITDDPTDYELGMRFQASSSGEITSLRYFRGAADAGDTDTRTLHLWSATGVLLASVEVTSGAGQSGWQTGTLAAPIQIEAGQTYVVSYGTTQNYVATQNYFTSNRVGADGALTGLGGTGNGVYHAGGTGIFPTSSYLNTNYWVDVVFEPGSNGTTNSAPTFTSAATVSAPENQTVAVDLSAADADGDSFVFAIAGGADASKFAIDPNTGLLTFLTAPDYEAPTDADGNNAYQVTVSVSDGMSPATSQGLTVNVTDAAEPGGTVWNLFGAAAAPDQIVTFDSDDYELGTKFVSNEAGLVTSLRYFRGAADAQDTDVRTLNLWSATGTKLATVTVTSAPGQTGWQTGTLDTPFQIQAGQTYVISYGTTQNYAFSGGFFDTDWVGPGGHLTAPGGPVTNGVFHVGSTGLFPEQSFNDANYWVDLTVTPLDPGLLV